MLVNRSYGRLEVIEELEEIESREVIEGIKALPFCILFELKLSV